VSDFGFAGDLRGNCDTKSTQKRWFKVLLIIKQSHISYSKDEVGEMFQLSTPIEHIFQCTDPSLSKTLPLPPVSIILYQKKISRAHRM
jgi:hypothetical protein